MPRNTGRGSRHTTVVVAFSRSRATGGSFGRSPSYFQRVAYFLRRWVVVLRVRKCSCGFPAVAGPWCWSCAREHEAQHEPLPVIEWGAESIED